MSSLFNCKLTNYSPYMAYTILSTTPLEGSYINKIYKRFNTKKYYALRHYNLNMGDRCLIKTTSLADGTTLQYSGKNQRYIDIGVKNYYCSIWLLVRGNWVLYRVNTKCMWNQYINIIINI